MRKRKLKILMQRIKRNKRIIDNFTHQGVSQGRMKLTCGTPFLWCKICLIFYFFVVLLLKICERNLTDMALRLRSILFQFTVSYMAVLRAWLFVYPTLFSSAL